MSNIAIRNNIKVIGEGERTLLLAHGFGCDQSMWQYITPSFADKFRVVLFDYVGSGHSDISAYNKNKYSTLHGYVQDVLDIIEFLELQEVIFIGHSVSSMIGMLASIERPEYFNKLVMIGPSPRYLNEGDVYLGGFDKSDVIELLDMMEMNFVGWASFMAPLAINDPVQTKLTQELEQSFNSIDPVIAREFAQATFLSDHRYDVSKSMIPTLIIQCSDDSIVPIAVGEYLHRNLHNSTFRLMQARGHYPHISHPKETVMLINEYLQVT